VLDFFDFGVIPLLRGGNEVDGVDVFNNKLSAVTSSLSSDALSLPK